LNGAYQQAETKGSRCKSKTHGWFLEDYMGTDAPMLRIASANSRADEGRMKLP